MTTSRNLLRISAIVLITALTCIAALQQGPGDAQAAVTLLYFRGQHNGQSVLLEWATATELNTAYFYLERADQEDGAYRTLDSIGIVASEAPPDGLSGAEYQRTDDDNVVAGQAYWYVLVEVESSQGTESRTQPIRVAQADAQPTNTATSTPTSTPVATATPQPLATSTAAPGVTPTGTTPGTSPTATPSGGRTVSVRSTPTAQGGQPTQGAPEFGQPAGEESEALATTTPIASYPEPAPEDPLSIAQTVPDSYPVLPTAEIFATRSYPAPSGGRDLNSSNGTPLPSIGASNRTLGANQQSAFQEPDNSPTLGTLFLWFGFAAALIVFVSAVAGAIYYYSRQRSGDS